MRYTFLPDMLDRAMTEFGARPAIDFLGRKMNFRELGKASITFAASLQQLGVKKGDRVGILLPNCPAYIIGYYAALRIGAVVVNINPIYAEVEIAHLIKD